MINRKQCRVFAAVMCTLFFTGMLSLAQGSAELRIAVNSPENLNPVLDTSDPGILFNRMIYDYLIDIAPDGTLIPNLASGYTVSDDGLTYTFTLVQGVQFHDGSAFDSSDAAFSFEFLREAGSPALNLLGRDYTVSAPDAYTLVLSLPTPNADFIYGVASRWSFMLPGGQQNPNVLAEGDAPLTNFNGTGAFVLQSYSPGENAVFVKNESYFRAGQPLLDQVTHIYIEDQQAQIDALRSGTVDFIFKIPFDRADELEAEPSINLQVVATNQHPVIRIRADEGSLGEDVRVRQAFKYATDRELLNLDLFDGRAAVGNNDPIGPKYGPLFNSTLENQPYNPQMACQLLADAGYPQGLGSDTPLEFYVVDAFNYQDMAILLRDMWREGCINVEILMRPENIYYGNNEWIDVQLGVTGWGDRPIAQQLLVEAYVTSALPENDGFNESHWSNAELDDLVAQAGVISSIEERAAIYARIAEIFRDDGPIIVPFFAPIVGATSTRVQGLELNPFPGSTDLRLVSVEG